MADDGIYTKNADIQALAGVNAGTTEKATAATDVYVLTVEAQINADSGFDWSTAWTASELDTHGTIKLTLTRTGAAMCAMTVISANPTGYSAREREMTLTFLTELYNKGMKTLQDTSGSALIKGE